MPRHDLADLADCTEFRQTLLTRPPRAAHATVALLAGLLAAAVTWAAATDADLVVRAAGRVRPVGEPTKLVNPARGELLTAGQGARVVEARFRPGDAVRAGDVLVRFDTSRLDAEEAKRKRAVAGLEREADLLRRQVGVAARQYIAARAKAFAEAEATELEHRRAAERRAAEVAEAEADLAVARDEDERSKSLADSRAISRSERSAAGGKRAAAEARLARAKLPADDARARVSRSAVALLEMEDGVRREDAALKLAIKEGELAAARHDLGAIELERRNAAVVAPHDGVVVGDEIKAGAVAEAGRVVAEVAPDGELTVEALVGSEDAGGLRPGMQVKVKVDAFDYQRYGTASGEVVSVAPDSVTRDGQAGAWYAVRIRLASGGVGRGGVRGELRLGMTAQVEIVTDSTTVLAAFFKRLRSAVSIN